MSYHGDYTDDYADLNFKFTTRGTDGVPDTLAGSPVIAVYKSNEDGTEKTSAEAYITLSVDFDSITGLNHVKIDLSADAFFVAGEDYGVVVTTGTVGGTSVVGEVVGSFSIENRYDQQTGDSFARIGVNGAGLSNINLPNQTMDIVGSITGSLSGSVASVSGNVDGNVSGSVASVAGNVDGNVSGSVASVAAAVVTDSASRTASKADVSSLALEASLDAIKGAGWSTETLVTIEAAILALNDLDAAGVWDLANGIETSWTPRMAVRVIAAACAGKLSGAATATNTIRSITDGKDRVTATVDANGNRSAVTLDGS